MTKLPMRFVVPGSKYLNLKKKTAYQVFHVGVHSESAETFVVYISAEDSLIDTWLENFRRKIGLMFLRWSSSLLRRDRVWVRPIQLFEEKFIELD